MSAFLGPIHNWLYGKIQWQEKLNQEILKAAEQNKWAQNLAQKTDDECGKTETDPLELVIDDGNNHGWLQNQIRIAESRYAYLVVTLMNQNGIDFSDIEAIAYQFGQAHAIEKNLEPSEVFERIDNCFLNGMPCDGVNRVVSEDEKRIVWAQTQCVHHAYWEQFQANVSIYYALREKIIEGMLADSELVFTATENQTYQIAKKE